MFRKVFLVIPIFMALCCCLGCPYSDFAYLLVTEEPNKTDIVGRYTLTLQTLTAEGLEVLDSKEATIELQSGGTYIATNFPIWKRTETSKYTLTNLLTTTGSWNIETLGGVDHGDGEIHDVWGICFQGLQVERPRACADLSGPKHPYSLMFVYGDPDSDQVMIFERKP
jgi:hypothetical protein